MNPIVAAVDFSAASKPVVAEAVRLAQAGRARTLHADYIVLGCHGHGAFYELIAGSTTTRVLRQARCPVVVVPQKKTGQ